MATIVLLAAATLLASCSRYPLPNTNYPVTVCPQHSRVPAASGEPGSASKLIPFAATHAMLCSYRHNFVPSSKLGGVLVGSAALNTSQTRQIVAELNKDVSPGPVGAVNCPADTGARVDGYFWAGKHHIEVTMKTDGCKYASNGAQSNAFTGDSNITDQLKAALSGH